MIMDYKDSNSLSESGLEKFNKVINSDVFCENPNANQIFELISCYQEFQKDLQTEERFNDPSFQTNDKKFALIFSEIIIDRLYYALHNNNNSDEFYRESDFPELADRCLYNLKFLCQNQFNEFDLKPILLILEACYFNDINREMLLELLPIPFVIEYISPFVKKQFEEYHLDWLHVLFSFILIIRTNDESEMIFKEVEYIKDYATDSKSTYYICHILNKMILNEILPIQLFNANSFSTYLTNLVHSNDIEIIKNALILIGRIICHKISGLENFTYGFFINLLFDNRDNEQIIVLIMWILSIGLNTETSNYMIESGIFDCITVLYHEVTTNSKIEISLFVSDVMFYTNRQLEDYLTYDVLEIIVDTFNIGNKQAIKNMTIILTNVIDILINRYFDDTIISQDEPSINLGLVAGFLFENDVLNLLYNLRSSQFDDDDLIDLINRLCISLENLTNQ